MNASSLSKAARRAASMNEEQKAFIIELLKSGKLNSSENTNHGLESAASIKDLSTEEKKIITYNGEQLTPEDILKNIIDPKNKLHEKSSAIASKIITEIIDKGKFNNYNDFINEKGRKKFITKKGNTVAKRIYNFVEKVIDENKLKYMIVNYDVIEEPNDEKLNLEDLTASIARDLSLTESSKVMMSPKNDQKPFKPDEEILLENDEKLPSIDDQKSSKNDQNLNDKEDKKLQSLLQSPKLKNTKKKASIKDLSTEAVPLSPVVEDGSLEGKEKQLFKNIELALSYKNNKEYQDNNVLEFKGKNGKIYKPDEPYKKLKALVHQKIADYIEELYNKFGYNSSEFRRLKQEIIDKINRRYFGKNNEYGFSVNNRGTERAFEIKYLEGPKQKRRADKNYVNQNTPNKDVFFKYSMKDVYDIIEEYLSIKLSVHSKSLIESIVSSSVDRYVKNAEKLGQVSYHTIAHGFYAAEIFDRSDRSTGVIKLIEKYINSKRNIHIKMKFEFDSDSRSKLMEIISREISTNQNDYVQKSKNIMSFIDSLKFS